ncbi:type II toxin-antitoxin system HicB family antitoxin [Pseudoduganella aquatica]|uniref:Toxin-antitoxin system HicB family antitoxin n=1 Tax=Pseudoduganella aquatica TaxID=2660641 RepID=A0A7X4HDJ2_9BURK|nr:type II toxin-antitoxin system HicB family antitoxin [Pseudoduganella aquatica]MYN08798.1 toxin-antitoxin system HicB family antitoxin [Pseudoduganella aquatica]
MNNIMKIDGQQAVIAYDPEIELFRGEFIGLNGGADFYAPDVAGLQREGSISLAVFLRTCKERGIEPFKSFSGKFVLRVDPAVHEAAALAAAADGKSLNQWASDVLKISLEAADNSYASPRAKLA